MDELTCSYVLLNAWLQESPTTIYASRGTPFLDPCITWHPIAKRRKSKATYIAQDFIHANW